MNRKVYVARGCSSSALAYCTLKGEGVALCMMNWFALCLIFSAAVSLMALMYAPESTNASLLMLLKSIGRKSLVTSWAQWRTSTECSCRFCHIVWILWWPLGLLVVMKDTPLFLRFVWCFGGGWVQFVTVMGEKGYLPSGVLFVVEKSFCFQNRWCFLNLLVWTLPWRVLSVLVLAFSV